MKITDSFIPSSSGLGDIHVRSWEPETAPVGILQIAHGVAEHVERYGDFAAFLVEKGWKVVAGDHLGHGKSAPETKGWFGEKNGWFNVVSDMKQIYDGNCVDNLPYFILGHSMGSFLLRTFLAVYPDASLSGVKILTKSKVAGVSDEGVSYTNEAGELVTIPADSVIMAAGMRANEAAAEKFRGTAPEFMNIGDSVKAANIKLAVRGAYDATMTF